MGISISLMQGQDAYSISVLPDAGTTNLQCESQLAFLGDSEVLNLSNTQMCLDAKLNCQNYISLEMENAEVYSPCTVDVDIENGNSGTPITNDDSKEKLKIEGPLIITVSVNCHCMSMFYNLTVCDNVFEAADQSMTDKVHESPKNRTRKYKRSVSMNARKVVLLFSALSSMGTIILIYLTLRVRQIGDGSIHT
ncbi:hypothetical protein RHGRI_030003 [Rhododendron griersonianum]|uniref:Uncharacterized protein n=1 Tax=Rhododendron griersonianum TaxID=479676 RepID=A0AAV6IL88_9ERIC|nr:hypothetical protein RHGRI_030003 [Rhododendron griersonianum]